MKKVRLLLADDHTVMRTGLRVLLERQPHLEVVGETENGRQNCRTLRFTQRSTRKSAGRYWRADCHEIWRTFARDRSRGPLTDLGISMSRQSAGAPFSPWLPRDLAAGWGPFWRLFWLDAWLD